MRITSLDGLRGFAVLLVMVYHSFMPYTRGGFIGVDIFFVLSGFLITSILLKEHKSNSNKINFKNFYMRRFLRLAPALLIVILSYFLYSQLVLTGAHKDGGFNASIGALFYFANLARAFEWFSMGWLDPTWSLSIEEQFYLIWPALFLLLANKFGGGKKFALLLLGIIILQWAYRIYLATHDATINRMYFGSDTHSSGLLMGCLTAILTHQDGEKPIPLLTYLKNHQTVIQLSAIVFFILSTLALSKGINWVYIWYFPLLEIVTSVLIFSLHNNQNKLKTVLFSNKILIALGSISYGLYLWHWFMFRIFEAAGKSDLQIFLYGSVSAIFLASVSYHFIEQPVLKFKKHYNAISTV